MNSLNNSALSLQDMTILELKQEYFRLRDKTEPADRTKFVEIENELLRRPEAQNQTTPTTLEKTSQEKIDEILKSNKTEEEKKTALNDIFLEEIKKHQNEKQNIQEKTINKQTEIDRLTAALNDEKSSNNELLTDTPSLKEYYSLERRRLSNTLKKFEKFKKEGKDNYPKNLLIYAMGITDTKIFGTRQKLKRGRATLAWKWNEDDIVGNLKIIMEKLKPDSGEKSKWKEAIKDALYKEIDMALKAHVEKLTAKNSLPSRK